MNSVALTGNDTTVLQNRSLTDFADGTVVDLSFPNNLVTAKRGKNGNTIYGLNEMGNLCNCVIRVIRGSQDDRFLNNLLSQQLANFAGSILLQGQFVKKIGDGAGNITSDTYILTGGMFEKPVAGQSNVEGESGQSVAVYTLVFSSAPRALT